MVKLIAVVTLVLLLTACQQNDDTLKVGSKDFDENRILAEMMAILAEDAQIPVTRRIGLGSTLLNLESLKRGDIDLYPEYNGTGLVVLGQPAMADGDQAMQRVRKLYEPLNLTWGQRLGFANNYGLAMQASRAEDLEIATISDLIDTAGDLTLGVDEEFVSRPLDGLQPLKSRYGFEFGTVTEVPPGDRLSLYDRVIDGEFDVIEVFTTDGQINDFGLVVLEDDLGFFPVYQSTPLIRNDALDRFPALADSLDKLAGQIDADLMRRLNLEVQQEALSPNAVARAALIELGLVAGEGDLDISKPLIVAVSERGPSVAESGPALRAVREAFEGRRVLLESVADALDSVGSGAARLALATTVEFATPGGDTDDKTRPFEAVGVVGQSVIHLVGLSEDVSSLGDIRTLLTGTEGSASQRAGAMLAAGLDSLEVMPVDADDLATAAGNSDADAALLLAPLGSAAASDLLAQGSLIATTGWEVGNNLVRFPWLREARIPAGTYEGQSEAVDTLSSQLVLAGPVVEDLDVVGPQGPAASEPVRVAELTDETISAIAEALDADTGFDPARTSGSRAESDVAQGTGGVEPGTGSIGAVGWFVRSVRLADLAVRTP